MLDVIAYVALPILVLLFGAYIYVEAQKRKAIKAKKRAIVVRIASIKHAFKTEMTRLVEQHILTVKQHESVYRIANNFFIFQPVTEKSIALFEHSLNNVIGAIPDVAPETMHFERLQEQIALFASSLPTTANGFNGNFYRLDLPKLINCLVNAKEKINKAETDLSNEQPLSSVSSEAA